MKWNERSREEQEAIERAILAAVRKADANLLAMSGVSGPARKAA